MVVACFRESWWCSEGRRDPGLVHHLQILANKKEILSQWRTSVLHPFLGFHTGRSESKQVSIAKAENGNNTSEYPISVMGVFVGIHGGLSL